MIYGFQCPCGQVHETDLDPESEGDASIIAHCVEQGYDLLGTCPAEERLALMMYAGLDEDGRNGRVPVWEEEADAEV